MTFQSGSTTFWTRLESLLRNNTRQKLLAEFAGTLVMVFAGTGAIVVNDFSPGLPGIVGIGLAFGLSVFVMIYLLGPTSGAHLNPAVTITLCLAQKIPIRLVLPFIVSQCAGAMCATLFLFFLFPHHPTLGATIPKGSITQSFILEVFLSFVLIFAILRVLNRSTENRIGPPLLIGSIIAIEAILGGPISGASMNPARSLAPALFSGHLNHLWIYLLAPLLGGIFAIPVSKIIDATKAHILLNG
jgi:MIP family channel proteins